jgi:thiamine-phosphate pyrophosphorylase
MLKGYYFITDATLSRAGNISDVKNAISAGVKVVQYRDKYSSTKQMYEQAKKLKSICKKATFLVNDRIDIALSVGADGVHLGNLDMPYSIARKILGRRKIIGLTVHTLKEAIQAEELGADYISVAPIFATRTKKDAGRPCGCGLISQIRKKVSLPIVAIGGITYDNASEVITCGADCVCAISDVVTQPNVRAQIEKFQALFKRE